MFEEVCEIVIVAGRNLVEKVNSRFTVETKGSDMDLVTEMDKKTEKIYNRGNKEGFPRACCFWRRNSRRDRSR